MYLSRKSSQNSIIPQISTLTRCKIQEPYILVNKLDIVENKIMKKNKPNVYTLYDEDWITRFRGHKI